MAPGARPRSLSDDDSLAARAAWLYFAGGLTQGEIAKRLGVPSTKAHRLVARANREGLVHVHVDARVADCVRLEEMLSERYGLAYCRVAPDLHEGPLPLKALGAAGAQFLKNAIEHDGHETIGVGHGRTLAAVVEQLPSMAGVKARFVSVLGGLTRKFAANPFDVIYRLAEKTGAEAYLMPVPVFANSPEDKAVLMAQMGVAEVSGLARGASLVFAGLGELESAEFQISMGLLRPEEHDEIVASGARGEILGHFFTADGARVADDFTARALAPDYDVLTATRVVAVAGGEEKTAAILAVLRGGLLDGLITDERTAERIAAADPMDLPAAQAAGVGP